MAEPSDKELLEKFRDENTRSHAFELLIWKYQKRIYWYVRRIVVDYDDAYDVVQNVFLKVWKKLHTFREDSSLPTWLYRIATREALNFLKKKKQHLFVSLQDVQQQLAENLEDAPYISGEEIRIQLEKAVLELPPKQRLVFILRYYEEKSYEEIASITGKSQGALHASYHHAMKKVEKKLKG